MNLFKSCAGAALFLGSAFPLFGANLMLDFGAAAATGDYRFLSPAHAAGTVSSATDLSWNTITSSSSRNDLSYSNGTAAGTGVVLTMGQEATAGNSVINFATSIGTVNLAGNGGGTNGQKSYLGGSSIYGADSTAANTAVGRDGFFGGTGSAIGLRVDGLAAGDYLVYVMARNTNSNAPAPGATQVMSIYATTGSSSGTFDFSSLTASTEANTTYATAGYANQYNTFTAGENYVATTVTVTSGQSIFLAVDGVTATGAEARGFLNMVQIVSIPEPATAMLGALGVLALARRRQR